MEEALIGRARAVDHLADRLVRSGSSSGASARIVASRCVPARARLGVEQPPRDDAVIDAHRPALVGLQIDEGELGRVRPDQPIRRADRREIASAA